jgi:hypothetical protein
VHKVLLVFKAHKALPEYKVLRVLSVLKAFKVLLEYKV